MLTAACLSALLLLSSPAFAANPSLELFDGYEKLGLAEPVKALAEVTVARGEHFAFSFRIPGKGAEPLTRVRFVPREKKAGPVPRVEVFFLGGHRLRQASASNLGPGFVEDILVPNKLLSLRRFRLPPGNLPARASYFVELSFAGAARAGPFAGELRFRRGKAEYRVPVRGNLMGAALPAEPALRTSFGFSPAAVMKRHGRPWNAEGLALLGEYVALALEHGVDLHKLYLEFPRPPAASLLAGSRAPGQSFTALWKKWGAPANVPGMRATDLPVPPEVKEPSRPELKAAAEKFWRALDASVQKEKLGEHSFVYFADEPPAAAVPGLAKNLRLIRAWAPHLRFLVVSPFAPELAGLVDIWVENLAHWARTPALAPATYLERRKAGESLWFYVSCNAHGCDGAEDGGSPDLTIDRPSAYLRALPWVARRYGAKGLLYYDTVYGYDHGAGAPWREPFSFTGAGEGNLFYPCTKKLCGAEAVLPSLRWKILRRGLEDAALLRAAEERCPGVQRWVTALVPNAQNFPRQSTAFEEVKVRALRVISASTAAGCP